MMKINVFVLFLTLLSLVAFTGSLFAQAPLPVYEGFNYAAGNLVGNAGWNESGNPPNTGNPVQVVDTSLSYTGLPASTGKKVALLDGSGYEDPGFDITPTGSDGTSIYFSFILNVVSAGTAGDYFFNVSTTGQTSTDYHSKVFVKQGAGGASSYLIGVRNASSDTIQYETADRTVGTTIFVVVSYDFVSGSSNDVSRVWINPTLGESVAPTANLTTTGSGTDLTAVGRIDLRQGSSDTSLSVEVDEIRAGTTWASATPNNSSVDDWTVF